MLNPSAAQMTMHRYEETIMVPAVAADVFAYLDAPTRLSGHMSKSSWMMGGGRMDISVDEGKGQRIGSRIRLDGTAFGLHVFLDEIVTKRVPPFEKHWQTIGPHRLFVIGDYRMGFKIEPVARRSKVCIFLEYELPRSTTWLGTLFAGPYAKWCVGTMLRDACAHFSKTDVGRDTPPVEEFRLTCVL